VEKHVGIYEDNLYGEAKVTEEKGKLALRVGTIAGDLEH